MRFLLIAVLSLFTFTASSASLFKDHVDRFTKVRTIVYYSSPTLETVQVPAASFVIAIENRELDVLVAKTVASKHAKYRNCNSIDYLADGKPVRLYSTKYNLVTSHTMVEGHITETFHSNLSLNELIKMSKAKVVEYRICNDVYRLTKVEMAGLRKVVGAFHGQK